MDGLVVLREYMPRISWDVWLGCAAVSVYGAALGLTIQDPFSGICGCVFAAGPMLSAAGLVLTCRLVYSRFRTQQRWSIWCMVVFALLSLSAGSIRYCINWHLHRQIELAGGLGAMESWARHVMNLSTQTEQRRLQENEIPAEIKSVFGSRVSVDLNHVSISVGGGFVPQWVTISRGANGRLQFNYVIE